MELPRMNASARRAFLARPHVGIFAVNEPGRGACAVPIWYAYEPGGVVRMTAGRESRKVQLLRDVGRASLCVQRERLPSAYVSVEGPVEIVETDVSELQREIAVRYLGEKAAGPYLESFAAGLKDEIMLVMRPERWWALDFGQLGGTDGASASDG
jgi:nitroimidazol reductase NimA-like FMN-containing flavoprotein (pyridoxamine 5'-phosphate oxidase superfamily)